MVALAVCATIAHATFWALKVCFRTFARSRGKCYSVGPTKNAQRWMRAVQVCLFDMAWKAVARCKVCCAAA